MTTSIIGFGNIGKAVARHLEEDREQVILAARDRYLTEAVARDLSEIACALPVSKAIAER
jgi:predicted dinucleotide-binding enzyme